MYERLYPSVDYILLIENDDVELLVVNRTWNKRRARNKICLRKKNISTGKSATLRQEDLFMRWI